MRKITIKIVAEDFSGVKLEANGAMMVLGKDYQYFLEDSGNMLFHYPYTKPTINRICRDAFAKAGVTIEDEEDLKKIERRFYDEDGKMQSHTMTEFLRPKDQRGKGHENYFGNDDHDREVLNELRKSIEEAFEKKKEELLKKQK